MNLSMSNVITSEQLDGARQHRLHQKKTGSPSSLKRGSREILSKSLDTKYARRILSEFRKAQPVAKEKPLGFDEQDFGNAILQKSNSQRNKWMDGKKESIFDAARPTVKSVRKIGTSRQIRVHTEMRRGNNKHRGKNGRE